MAKKTFKDKEDSFKKKNGIPIGEKEGYTPQKTKSELALELLTKKGFKVSVKDDILYCECEDADEYDAYRSALLEHFGREEKVPFSFGATLKKGFREEKEDG